MDNPGLSMFNNGVSLHVDAVKQQEAEEDEDDAEEQRRIQQEVQADMEEAFNDIDLDDSDESEDTSQEDNLYPKEILTPGQVPLKHVTSTPFHQNNFQMPVQYHQLQAEETSMIDEQETTYTHAAGTNQYPVPQAPLSNGQGTEHLTPNYTPFPTNNMYASNNPNNMENGTNLGDYYNKSDNEKVKENSQLFAMYTERGQQIEQLKKEINSLKNDHASQVRQLRQHLASTAEEREQQGGQMEKYQQLLADAKRENQLLVEEIHPLKEELRGLLDVKESLEMEHSGDKETIIQLQQKISQLESTDMVLKARQQYDALVRSIKERHENEMQRVRQELDTMTSAARDKEHEVAATRSKLAEAQNQFDFMLREKTSLIDELSSKCGEYQKKLLDQQQNNQALEIARLQTCLKSAEARNDQLELEVRNYRNKVNNLESEVSGYEAMGSQELSESVIALGLATSKSEGATRLKEELQRSLSKNRTSRENIAKLESDLKSKILEMQSLKGELEKTRKELDTVQTQLKEKIDSTSELTGLRQKVEELERDKDQLIKDLKEAEEQNIQVKRCMTEMLEGNQEDKMEAIDSLREEYEEHCKKAVEQTKSLMEGEIRRLKIEVDVYNGTILELRKKLDQANKESNQAKVKELEDKIQEKEKSLEALRVDKNLLECEVQSLRKQVLELTNELGEEKQKLELQAKEKSNSAEMSGLIEKRVEEVRQQLRDIWEKERKSDIEEAVAAARLDWLKRLPEAEKPGGAARVSINQMEEFRKRLAEHTKEKESLKLKLADQDLLNQENESTMEKMRVELANVRKELLDAEAKFHTDLVAGLGKQAEQWQQRLTTARQHAEEQRKLIENRYESDRQNISERLQHRDKEVSDLESKLDSVETEYSLARDKWRRVLEDKNQTILGLKKTNSGDVELLKAELNRKVEEVEQQRTEMSAMADRWATEVKNIQATHQQEKKELAEMTEKYVGLKSKVRKYQRHVEQKENHYKQEYTRLENEFKSTLERLRERMEQAYSNKEKQVERELGQMRTQFTQELKNIAARKQEPPPARQTDSPQLLNSLDNIQSEPLKQYYINTSNEIQQLLK